MPSEWIHGSGRKGNEKRKLKESKEKCPACGEMARTYNDGSWESHRSYDYDKNGKRKGSKYSTCKGPK